ncbi:MAG TPA: HEAT repeat domain-containing protein [Bryobacteraceae bacterium]|nr:HEAT repeat domain-containing protein [Bryobacteraceae bacterium]
MAVRNVERELEDIKALRTAAPGEARTRALHKALKDKVNVIAAKAAGITAELEERSLIPDLLATFDRFLFDPVKSDPQCWGKNAIAKALRDLGHAESDVYLRGARHVQYEPVWGGEEDTAANLRGTCALALLNCTDITREDKLWFVMPLLTEQSPSLKKDGAIALESLAGREAALMLRIKARMGDKDPGVTGQVFESLLRVERDSAVPFVIEFLRSPNPEVREEAALALGASRLTSAIDALEDAAHQHQLFLDIEIFSRALAISRNEKAIDILLDIIRSRRSNEAVAAVNALALYRDSPELVERIKQAVSNRTEPEIQRNFTSLFSALR